MVELTKPWEQEWAHVEDLDGGGQGIVSVLRNNSDSGRRAVLKQITQRWRGNRQAIDRLHLEAETLTKLNTAGARVPQVFDSSLKHQNAEPFILMQFVEGIRFDKWLRTKAPTTPNDALTVVKNLAETIRLCHEQEIGHRDLKPANIILRDSEITKPYVLDFGIAFDSKQTVALTEKGEIFRNEFITLPECQDLEGHHRDLRSDITALAGIFFNCLTGKAPIVLLDGQELAPHERHERILNDVIASSEHRERLSWFFDKAFAYNTGSRFQELNEFLSELDKSASPTPTDAPNLSEEFGALTTTVNSVDRGAQLVTLRNRLAAFDASLLNRLTLKIAQTLRPDSLKRYGFDKNVLSPHIVSVPGADILNNGITIYCLGVPHYKDLAAAVCLGFGVGMQIHIYAASYTAPVNRVQECKEALQWQKVAVIDDADNTTVLDDKVILVANHMELRLASELRNLRRALGSR